MNQIIILFISAAIGLAILYFIISSASKSDELLKEQRTQTRLLSRLLEEKGVTKQEVENILNY